MKTALLTTVLVVGAVLPTAVPAADGEKLFSYHGCFNCHGAEAREPISKDIPVLAGKSQDELFKRSKKILTGKGATKASQMMHAAFYSPAQCDVPPNDAELTAITAYLASLPEPMTAAVQQ